MLSAIEFKSQGRGDGGRVRGGSTPGHPWLPLLFPGLISLTSGVAGTGGRQGPVKAGYGVLAHILRDIHLLQSSMV